jgi:hypothetical protein
VPLQNSTSKTKPIVLTKGQSTIINATQANNANQLWCTNCWYYIAVITHAPSMSVKHNALLQVQELRENTINPINVVQTNT